MTRTDDIINVAAHRLSTGEIEKVLAAHPDVAECAVIGIADALKGQVPLGLLVLKAGTTRNRGGNPTRSRRPRARAHRPGGQLSQGSRCRRPAETWSGKILRGTMRKIADAEPYPVPATIDDPAVLSEIEQVLARSGYGGATIVRAAETA